MRIATLALLSATLIATSAQAATRQTLASPTTSPRDCRTLVSPGARGVAQVQYRAPADGIASFRLQGVAGDGDWDLALFDSEGTFLAGSLAFAASELATTGLRKGARITVQACRRSGDGVTVPLSTDLQRLDFAALDRELRASRPRLVEVAVIHPRQIDSMEALGLDVTHDVRPGAARVILYGDADLKRLRTLGLPFRTVVADMLARDRANRRRDAAYARTHRRSPLPSGRTEYRTYEDYQAELKDLAAKNPDLVRPITLEQKSFQGREIGAIEVAADVNRADDGRPTVYINGVHHAREWPAAEAPMEFAHDLVKGYGNDARITQLLKRTRIVIQPLVNPDGFIVARSAPAAEDPAGLVQTATGVVVFGGSLAYKRKNCNNLSGAGTTGEPCELVVGVDNNRNYASGWGGPGASTNPNDQSYRGSGALSETESQGVVDLQYSRNVTMHITIHNVAALVLRPPGLEAEGFAPDEENLKFLGEEMAVATGYTNQYGWELYDTTGTTDDHVYSETGSFGYTIEMGPSGGDFHGAYEESVIGQYDGNEIGPGGMREALMLAAENSRTKPYTSRLTGRAPAGRTLRITKQFDTETYTVCAQTDPTPVDPLAGTVPDGNNPWYCTSPGPIQKIPAKLDFTTVVPASGRIDWWVNPSTRPFVFKADKTESYTLTCEDGGKVIETHELVVRRGETRDLGDLKCGGTIPKGGGKAAIGAVKLGRAKLTSRGRLRIKVKAGGPLKKVKVALLARRGSKVLATGRAKKLTRRAKVVSLRLRPGVSLAPGRYRVRLKGVRGDGKRFKVTRAVRLR